MNQSPVLGNLNVVFKLLVSRIIIFFLAYSAGVFFGCANVLLAKAPQGLLFLLSLIFPRHNIKDGGFNCTNINNQLSPAKKTPAAVGHFFLYFSQFLSRYKRREIIITIIAYFYQEIFTKRSWSLLLKFFLFISYKVVKKC